MAEAESLKFKIQLLWEDAIAKGLRQPASRAHWYEETAVPKPERGVARRAATIAIQDPKDKACAVCA